MAAAADAVKRLFAGAGDWVSGGFGPVVCHGDFSPDNLLFEGDALTGVLDFDRAYAGQAARDLAGAANAVWMHDPAPDWDPRAECVEGYRAGRDPGASFERVEPLYRVETLAKAVAGMADLGTLSGDERTFYDGRIARAVERAERE
jgi:Ser/Thr protein kinase RdoA (MazF antagonist)